MIRSVSRNSPFERLSLFPLLKNKISVLCTNFPKSNSKTSFNIKYSTQRTRGSLLDPFISAYQVTGKLGWGYFSSFCDVKYSRSSKSCNCSKKSWYLPRMLSPVFGVLQIRCILWTACWFWCRQWLWTRADANHHQMVGAWLTMTLNEKLIGSLS